MPANVACHIEQETWQHKVAIHVRRSQVRQVAEDDRKDHRGQQRLDDRPRRPQDRLLVQRREVALDKQHDQVTVLEGLLEMEVKEVVVRGDVGFEVLIHAKSAFYKIVQFL